MPRKPAGRRPDRPAAEEHRRSAPRGDHVQRPALIALTFGQLVRILPEWEAPQGMLHLVFTSRRGLLPGVRAVIDFAAETLHPRAGLWRTAA